MFLEAEERQEFSVQRPRSLQSVSKRVKYWQEFQAVPQPSVYFSPCSDSVPVELTYIFQNSSHKMNQFIFVVLGTTRRIHSGDGYCL